MRYKTRVIDLLDVIDVKLLKTVSRLKDKEIRAEELIQLLDEIRRKDLEKIKEYVSIEQAEF